MLNSALDAFRIPDLRRKLVFTMLMLVAFRFIAHIPVPGADVEALSRVFQTNQLAGFFDLFSGGALSSLSIAALGVYPYITAQIIMQIMQPAIPKLQEVAKEGESGRQKINQWTHYLTVPLAMFQAYGTPNLINFSSGGNTPIIKNFGFDVDPLGTLAIIISMTAGTMLLVWMGELITQYGVGQGVSIIIFGGIMARLPFQVFQGLAGGADFGQLIMFGVLGVLTVVAIIYIYEGQRRIPVQISKQIRGNRVYGGGTTHIPLKVNSAGMIPLIFASSMLILPWTISSYFVNSDNQIISSIATTVYNTFNAGTSPFYWFLYFIMVVAFTFFYALVIFQQQNIAENLQRQNGFIPGIRPGRPTHQYLSQVLIRITVAGALFLGIVAVLPFIVKSATGFQTLTISSTAVLIVVGVALDTMRQLEAQLIMRNYRGFIGR
ncbi:MAG: preprotein translocase subunit SecY [Chloroflexi bacterium]|nr:preprotein translocase subunit SecY [Chloroflexota bacterium]MBV9599925.1 preprotein translocase subunit SecY [Chloroflexota bacterium]